MKKLVCVVLMLACIFTMSVGAFAAAPEFVVSGASAKVGEEFTVTVSTSGNPGVAGVELNVEYDSSVLEWTGFEKGVSGTWSAGVGEALTWFQADGEDQTGDFTFATLTFKALAAGDTTVSVSYLEDNVYNADLDNVAFGVKAGSVSIKDHDHVYDSGTVTAPTCSKEGFTTYKCTVEGCTESYVDNKVPATGEHKFVETERKEATCKDAGYVKYACECGEPKEETLPATGEHNYVEVDHKDPTCKEDGYCKFECGCGENYTETKPATGEHVYVETERVDATCKAEGYVISKCGCGEEQKTTLEKIPHDYVLTERVEATCTETGYEIYICSMCGAESDKILQKVDHKFENYTVTKEATCTEDGKEVGTCAFGCGTTNELPIDKLDHDWSDWKVTKEATKTEKGEKVRVCDVCDETETKDIPATGSVAPKTGDEANIALYAVIFMMAAAGVVVLSLKKKEN